MRKLVTGSLFGMILFLILGGYNTIEAATVPGSLSPSNPASPVSPAHPGYGVNPNMNDDSSAVSSRKGESGQQQQAKDPVKTWEIIAAIITMLGLFLCVIYLFYITQ